jgi:hypothetical protein
VIHDVDESLRALVRRDVLTGNGVEIAFDAPTKDWVARRNAPVVDLYLYDIREDLSRRQTTWEAVRDDGGRVTERRLPPRRYRLSYLVTAWTQRPEDEHRLLSGMLACFARNEAMPPELLAGSLAGTSVPVILTVCLPPAEDRSIADVWSAMGGELKPSLDLIVTAPLELDRAIEAGPPVLEEPRVSVVRAEPAGASGARRGRRGSTTVRPGGRSGAWSAAEGPSELVEERRAGGLERPGRTLRLRGLPRPRSGS